jgi:putative AdoMet-dependent methyltransferase
MNKEWYYNEFIQTGTDFADIKKVEAYDTKMLKFRNYKQEAEFILKTLNVKSTDTILEIGTGTGHFAFEAAKKCHRVYAIDVSKPMLDYAKLKAEKENLNNIEWLNYGFLSFDFPDNLKFDSVVSNAALHHLPDFWKMIAIKNIYKSLKDNGKFILGDVIFSFKFDELNDKINEWINNSKKIDIEFGSETITHIRDEYSTYSWIIEGMFERIGFKFQKLNDANANNFAVYLCSK